MSAVLLLLPALLGLAASAYVFPDIAFQARAAGGLKAFLPDSCGVEGFGLQVKGQGETSWRTGNGTKTGRLWSWEDRGRSLKVGDSLEYSPRVWYRGASYSLPITVWRVTELVDDYSLPTLEDLNGQECTPEVKNSTTPKPKEEEKSKEPPKEPAHRQPYYGGGRRGKDGLKPKSLPPNEEKVQDTKHVDDNDHPDSENHDDNDDSIEDDKGAGPVPGPPSSTGPSFSISCNWLDPPGPGLTKEEVLERQLAILQCEMSSFLERTTKLTAELNKELLDLKKLNYATVARMQRLESLIRTIPRAVPFNTFSSF